jgi:riboflavin kinase / FMN adenylyltransferase
VKAVNVLRSISDLGGLRGPVHLAIGVFDGVHIGHQAVIAHALKSASDTGGTAAIVTFDPHPAQILRPTQAPALLTSTRHKLRLLAGLGVADTLVIPFDAGFAATPPSEFVHYLASACALRQICVGQEWAFGKARAGNLSLLRELGEKFGFEAVGLPGVSVDGEAVSSTAIRGAVQVGDLADAAKLLGRPFSIFSTVIEGNKLGRTLGFPTANLRPECEQLPPNGVYAVQTTVNGKRHPGVANIGVRPTVAKANAELLLEAHLFDFAGNLYGQDAEVHFLHFLRAEQKFPSLEALKAQIAADAARARELLGG